ncbi:MAG: hypothetical protein AB8V23_05360 [Candidatus Midichloria sp.]|uniref:Uncharacterized protein n=1 Tax=Hyalomma marginatum TaxID=34627 RepID=A0A8S4C1Y2_9ACAR|nr:hypothetical protein MHYMCMPASI_00363 [Hyalomma marginatum]CAG7592096.1 hypothetical protein MHYMCMPSP_00600 [Hyalomma marginatum]
MDDILVLLIASYCADGSRGEKLLLGDGYIDIANTSARSATISILH